MLKHSYQDDQCKKIANCGGINKNQGQRILNLCIVYKLICIFNVLIFVCLSVCSNFLGGPRYNRGNVLYNSVEQWVVLSSSVKQRECFYSSVEPRECSLQLGRTAGMFFIARQNSGLFFLARQNSGNVFYSSVDETAKTTENSENVTILRLNQGFGLRYSNLMADILIRQRKKQV